MKPKRVAIAAGLVGLACGLVSHSVWLEGRWFSLVVWGLAGAALGWFLTTRPQLLWAGIVFGVVLSVTFLLSGFQGSADKLPGFLLLTLLLSAVGAVGGLVSVAVGARLKRLFR